MRHRLDARRLRRAPRHRQHDVSQALFRLARPLQHRARERPAHPRRFGRRMAAAVRAVGLRNGPLRLPLDLSIGTTGRSPSRRASRARSPPCSGASPSKAANAASSSSATSPSASMNTRAAAASRSTRDKKQFVFRPDPEGLWGQRYPLASYRLVTSTPKEVEAIGGDELLYLDGERRGGGYAVIRTRPTRDPSRSRSSAR